MVLLGYLMTFLEVIKCDFMTLFNNMTKHKCLEILHHGKGRIKIFLAPGQRNVVVPSSLLDLYLIIKNVPSPDFVAGKHRGRESKPSLSCILYPVGFLASLHATSG